MSGIPREIRARVFDYKKAVQAASFFAFKSKEREIDRMKALKLLFLADKYHLRKYGRPITWDRYCALPSGPVASSTMDIMELDKNSLDAESMAYASRFIQRSKTDADKYISVEEPDWDKFSKSDLEALEAVFEEFGGKTGPELRDITHDLHHEWKSARDNRLLPINNPPISYEYFFNDVAAAAGKLFKQSREEIASSEEQFDNTIDTMKVLYG